MCLRCKLILFIQLSFSLPIPLPLCQYVELMSRRQGELDTLVAVGYRSALTEERRRYCFLVDRQCAVTKLLINYHCKVRNRGNRHTLYTHRQSENLSENLENFNRD